LVDESDVRGKSDAFFSLGSKRFGVRGSNRGFCAPLLGGGRTSVSSIRSEGDQTQHDYTVAS